MTVSELISALSEFDGTELVCIAPAPGDPRSLRIANDQVYGIRTTLDEGDESGVYNVVIIEY